MEWGIERESRSFAKISRIVHHAVLLTKGRRDLVTERQRDGVIEGWSEDAIERVGEKASG